MELGEGLVGDLCLVVARFEVASRKECDEIRELSSTELVHKGDAQDVVIIRIVDVVLAVLQPLGLRNILACHVIGVLDADG